MKVLKRDIAGPWELDKANETWLLAKTATITSDVQVGILASFDNTTLRIAGKILGNENSGVYTNANTLLDVTLMKTAKISGFDDGISAANSSVKVLNEGVIAVDDEGIYANGGGSVVNRGTISGTYGITANGRLDIDNSGSIEGADYGIEGFDFNKIVNRTGGEIVGKYAALRIETGGGVIRNNGVIRSDEAAILSSGSDDVRIVNHGRIIGDITLDNGDDVIDLRAGKIRGVVSGGEGDDTYLISGPVKIMEDGASFGDVLKSTVSASLIGTGIDDLYLLGKRNIDGLGNDEDNLIRGNRGHNILTGAAGEDILDGGAGKDVLSGGDDADIFRFHKGNGVDVIVDFEDGIDLIGVDDDFRIKDVVSARQRGDNLVVDFVHGDRLIFKDFEKANFDVNDFTLED